MLKKSPSILLAGVLAFAPAWARAEHPHEHPSEHPQAEGKKAGEHPAEHSANKAGCSLEDVVGAAEQYVAKEVEKKGAFKVWDRVQKRHLDLSLMQVHRDRLAKVGKDTYFVCADFKDKDGTVYDVDLFMKGKNKDNLKLHGKPKVHKVNGEPRYDWVEKKGIWKRVARKAAP